MTSYIGLLAQTATAILIAVLLFLLRQQHRERDFFHMWCMAWLSLSIALLALVFSPFSAAAANKVPNITLLVFYYSVYLVGKFCFYLLLIEGTIRFVKIESFQVIKIFRISAVLLLLLALLLPWFQQDLNVLVWAQVPIACASGLLCAYLFWQDRRQRSFGTRYCAAMFLAMSALWLFYGLTFPFSAGSEQNDTSNLVAIRHYNSYYDLLVQQLLAFGFVVLLLEQGRRETDIAHKKLSMAHEQLKDFALNDQLTGAGNRLALYNYPRNQQPECALIACDLDFLKPINDQYGHAAGDQLLTYFVEVMRKGLTSSDCIFRIGGDEFVLIMPAIDFETGLERVRNLLQLAPALIWQQQHSLRLQSSFGGVNWEIGTELELALQQADQLMYKEKRNNKNRITDQISYE